ncbi:MAG: DUF1501 domain-containing protein [Acidobacteria bacterium]|nr:DUF1501 domain-containing protein [Acidobacteriota bacterium]
MYSRRLFVKSGAMAMLSLGCAPSFLARAAEAAEGRRRLLIAIFQRGAVDGLNMVVPYGEAEYYRLRPSIAVPRPGRDQGAIDLDGFFGLHPVMAPLTPLWNTRSLAVVHASGSPDATRSHFDAQDYMETATPGVKSTRDGWLNRYLQSGGSARSPLRAIAVARQMPRTLQGRAPSLALGAVEEFRVRAGGQTRRGLETAFAADTVLGPAVSDAFDAMRTLQAATTGSYRPAPGASYPRSPFGQALQEIARVAKAGVGLEIAFAESGSWDHHVNEGGVTGQVANRLADLAEGLAALTTDLGELLADTVVMTMSEFGRAVAENGSGGTDHGHGNAMLLIGGPVRGGRVYGRWPGLREDQRFEGRDLEVTTDFREVFSEVAARHLGAPAAALARIFPGFMARGGLGVV